MRLEVLHPGLGRLQVSEVFVDFDGQRAPGPVTVPEIGSSPCCRLDRGCAGGCVGEIAGVLGDHSRHVRSAADDRERTWGHRPSAATAVESDPANAVHTTGHAPRERQQPLGAFKRCRPLTVNEQVLSHNNPPYSGLCNRVFTVHGDQSPTPLWSRPSTTPSNWPLSRSTMVVIQGSNRVHGPRVLELAHGSEAVRQCPASGGWAHRHRAA